SSFPIVVNDLVVEQLNFYLGNAGGRAHMKKSLDQMQKYKNLLAAATGKYKLPNELLAVPVIESGYTNYPQNPKQAHGAGIWMFVRATAQHYGLRVDKANDERLNVVKETDAAMRLFSAYYLRFLDWGLVLLAYNCGESYVGKAMTKTGSKDPWELMRQGYKND